MGKKHYSKSSFGNKGFIFTLDALVAVFIVALIISVSSIFAFKQLNQKFNSLQIDKIGADVIATLDYRNDFNSLDKNYIDTKIKNLLPKNYDISYKMVCQNITIVQGEPPSRSFRSGERIIVTNNLDYCHINYQIWPK